MPNGPLFLRRTTSPQHPSMPAALILETHSEALINAVGECVSRGELLPSDVQVLLVQHDTGASSSTIRHAAFDNDGVLQNWPYGFFLP